MPRSDAAKSHAHRCRRRFSPLSGPDGAASGGGPAAAARTGTPALADATVLGRGRSGRARARARRARGGVERAAVELADGDAHRRKRREPRPPAVCDRAAPAHARRARVTRILSGCKQSGRHGAGANRTPGVRAPPQGRPGNNRRRIKITTATHTIAWTLKLCQAQEPLSSQSSSSSASSLTYIPTPVRSSPEPSSLWSKSSSPASLRSSSAASAICRRT